MGEFFSSFEQSWNHFLARREPLEDYYDQYPIRDTVLAGWLLRVDHELAPAFAAVQEPRAGAGAGGRPLPRPVLAGQRALAVDGGGLGRPGLDL